MVQVAVAAGASAPSRTRSGLSLTWLVVEDDPALLHLAADVLRDEGHHVLTAADAFGALALLLSHSVDLLFTDINLAHRSCGLRLARDARALRSNLLVAYASGKNGLAPDQMVPGSVFLPKPYRIVEVIGLPQRLIELKAA